MTANVRFYNFYFINKKYLKGRRRFISYGRLRSY